VSAPREGDAAGAAGGDGERDAISGGAYDGGIVGRINYLCRLAGAGQCPSGRPYRRKILVTRAGLPPRILRVSFRLGGSLGEARLYAVAADPSARGGVDR